MSEEISKINKLIMVVLYSLSVLFFFISFWFFMYSWDGDGFPLIVEFSARLPSNANP